MRKMIIITFLLLISQYALANLCHFTVRIAPEWQTFKVKFYAHGKGSGHTIYLGTFTRTGTTSFNCDPDTEYEFKGEHVTQERGHHTYFTELTAITGSHVWLFWPEDFDAPRVPRP